MSYITAAQRVYDLTDDQAEAAWADWQTRKPVDFGLPNIYRVRPKGRGRWQCEWDDMPEVGAFRSRSLGRAVRRAQRARRKEMGEALFARRYRPLLASEVAGS